MAKVGIQYVVDTSGAVAKIKEFGRATGQLSKQVLKTTGTIQGLAGIVGRLALIETGRRMVSLAASMKQTQLRLKLLSDEFGEYEKTQRLVAKASKTFGLSTREATEGIADIYARLRPIGVTMKDIESTFIGFNTAAKLSGVSAQQASGAFLQLAQALGSGRLQGDEFRSIAEQLPKLNQVIAKSMGIPIGQLKAYASQGKLTAEEVIKALKKIEKDGAGAIAGLLEKDPSQKFKNLNNAVETLSASVGGDLLVVVAPAAQALADLMGVVNEMPAGIRITTVAILGSAAALVTVAPLIVQILRSLRILRVFMLRKLIPTLHLTKAAFGPIAIAAGLVTVAVAAMTGKYIDNNRELEKNIELMKTGTKAAVEEAKALKIIEKSEAEAALRLAQRVGGQGKKGRIRQAQEDLAAINKDIEGFNARLEAIPAEEAAAKLAKANAAMAALGKTTRQTSEEFKTAFATKFKSYLDNVNDVGGKMASIIVGSFQKMEDALFDFVQGGKLDFTSLINYMIKELQRLAIQQAILSPLSEGAGKIFAWLSKFLIPESASSTTTPSPTPSGQKASGGPVSRGSSYLVGERGPEMFTPHSSGSITPNHRMGGTTNISVAVDAKGSKVEGDGSSAKRLGSAISDAIRRELITQQRPGGLLA